MGQPDEQFAQLAVQVKPLQQRAPTARSTRPGPWQPIVASSLATDGSLRRKRAD